MTLIEDKVSVLKLIQNGDIIFIRFTHANHNLTQIVQPHFKQDQKVYRCDKKKKPYISQKSRPKSLYEIVFYYKI